MYPKITPLLPFGLRPGRSTVYPRTETGTERVDRHSPRAAACQTEGTLRSSGVHRKPQGEVGGSSINVNYLFWANTDCKIGTVGARPKVGSGKGVLL